MRRLVICCDGTWNRADQARDGILCRTSVLAAVPLFDVAKMGWNLKEVIPNRECSEREGSDVRAWGGR